jgi:hypothetical protein
MKYYHGTNMIINAIDLTKSRNRVDFGKGFYLTDKIGTAQIWAIRKVELEGEGIPTILCYETDSGLYDLYGQRFPDDPNLEWLNFICSNRRNVPPASSLNEPRHAFNWVSGAMADDKIVDVVAEFLRGETTDEEAIRRAKALPKTYQLSLHTALAVSFIDHKNVTYKQLKKGNWSQNWIAHKF